MTDLWNLLQHWWLAFFSALERLAGVIVDTAQERTVHAALDAMEGVCGISLGELGSRLSPDRNRTAIIVQPLSGNAPMFYRAFLICGYPPLPFAPSSALHLHVGVPYCILCSGGTVLHCRGLHLTRRISTLDRYCQFAGIRRMSMSLPGANAAAIDGSDAKSATASRWRNPAIYFAAAWSGFFVMGIELLGGRLLAPYFGSSIFVWGALIAVFMTCLAIGYLIGGQLSLRTPSLGALGMLLIAEALLALPVVYAGDPMLDWLSFTVSDPRYGSLIAAILLFGAPTLFSGMVSPYAVRLLIDDLEKSGRSAGRLYFASTLGSAGGTILTTFYLVLFLEINTIILCLIGISFFVGAALCLTMRNGHGR
jgi:hypothetical protein